MSICSDEGVLKALAEGWTLKSHRYLDGDKVYRLHPLEGGEPEAVDSATVQALRERGLIESNMKFPAATYLLTDKGRQVAAGLVRGDVKPLGGRKFS